MTNNCVDRNEAGNIAITLGDHELEMAPLEAVKLAFLLLRYSGVPMSVDLMNRILGNFERETVN